VGKIYKAIHKALHDDGDGVVRLYGEGSNVLGTFKKDVDALDYLIKSYQDPSMPLVRSIGSRYHMVEVKRGNQSNPINVDTTTFQVAKDGNLVEVGTNKKQFSVSTLEDRGFKMDDYKPSAYRGKVKTHSLEDVRKLRKKFNL